MSTFPCQGNCVTNQTHRIFLRLTYNKSFIPNKCCNKCSLPFNKIYYNGMLVSTHYYECKKCETKICVNCAMSANKCDEKWNDVRRLTAPTQETFKYFPKINQKWLNVNNALDNMSKDDLKKTMKKVIKLLGGLKNTLFFVTKNLSHAQLNDVYNLMMEQGSLNEKFESTLESMPHELLSYISSFLKKTDIKSFKLCSRKVSLLCLQEMEKVSFDLLDGNKMLLCDDMNPSNLHNIAVRKRYSANKSMCSVIGEWKGMINIQQEKQLFFKRKYAKCSYSILNKKHLKRYRTKNIKKACIGPWGQTWHGTLVLDASKVVLMTGSLTAITMDKVNLDHFLSDCNDLWFDIPRYKLVILQYFDIHRQKLKVVQFILCEKRDLNRSTSVVVTPFDVLRYFENSFIEIDGVDNEWYHELQDILNKMEHDDDERKLILHNGNGYLTMPRVRRNSRWGMNERFTLQINPNHPWFLANKSKIVKEKGAIDYRNFTQRFTTYRVSFEDKEILSSCLQKYFDQRLSKKEQRAFQPSIDVIFDFVNAEFTEIKVRNVAKEGHVLHLKQRIAQKLDHIISINAIDVQIQHESLGLYSATCCIFLPYIGKDKTPKFLYRIRVFLPNDTPFPYQYGRQGAKTLMIQYGELCTDRPDVTSYLFERMRSATDHIYYPYYKGLIDLYYKKGLENNENIKAIMTKGEDGVYGNNFLMIIWIKTMGVAHVGSSPMDMNLYLIKHPKKTNLNTIKLEIKFIQHCTGLNIDRWNFVGFPMTVWINEWDTMQTVIDLHLKKIKKYILESYRMTIHGSNRKAISIQKYKWENYKIVQRMKLPNDCLVIKTAQREENNIFLPHLQFFDYQTQNLL